MAAKLEDLAGHRESRRQAATPKGQVRSTGRRCPICGGPPVGRYRPFCSARCADVDLARWLNESYRVPGETAERPVDPDNTDRSDD
jgi:uncharacterized protein